MIYRRRASALHAARAGVTALYGLALITLALCFTHPLVLGALALAAVLGAGLAGCGREVLLAGRYALALAVLIALVNALVVRDGLTVVARLGELPPFGQIDITLEALLYGVLLGVRVFVIVLCTALLTAVVDPDELLRVLRRVSLRSALTAALATRMVPILARDAGRMEQARRCRADADLGSRRAQLAVVRAVCTGALDRAVDVAATLELRGYGAARRGAGSALPRPWSRHDWSVAGATFALVALGAWGLIAGVATLAPYPRIELVFGAREIVLACAIVLAALAPLASRRGVWR